MPRRPSLIHSEPFAGQTFHNHSLLFGTNNESLRNLSRTHTLGFADAFTISQWYKHDTSHLFHDDFPIFFTESDSGAFVDYVQWDMKTDGTPGGGADGKQIIGMFACVAQNSSTIRCHTFEPSPLPVDPNDKWSLFTITWDGSNIRGYIDDQELDGPVDGPPFNANPTLADPGDRDVNICGRRTALAGEHQGPVHTTGIWNVALPPLSIQGLYLGKAFDWRNDRRQYQHSSGLVLYWEHGKDPADLGAPTLGSIDVGNDAENLSSDDIVTDFPGAP